MLILLPVISNAESNYLLDRIDEHDVDHMLFTLAGFSVIDYYQSVDFLYRDPSKKCDEMNPALGSHPSRRNMLEFGTAAVGGTYLFKKLVYPRYPNVAKFTVIGITAFEIFNVVNNMYNVHERKPFWYGLPIVMMSWEF